MVAVRCEPDQAAARAGIEPGDIIVGWRSGDRHGTIDSPFGLALVEQQEPPRGAVLLEVRRRGRGTRRMEIPPGLWGLLTRPNLAPLLTNNQRPLDVADGGELDRAVSFWRTTAARKVHAGRPEEAAWYRMQAATALAEADREDEAERELRAGADLIVDPSLRAVYWERAGNAFLEKGRKKAASTAFMRAIELHETVDGDSAAVAFTLLQLCRIARRSHETEARRALAIYRALEGDGMETAQAFRGLALFQYSRSRYDRAEARYREALAIVERLAPEADLLPDLLGRLGLAVLHQGDFEAARKLFHRELDAARRLEPTGPRVGYANNHLGLVAKKLGEYSEARSWYVRGLEIYRACRPGGVEVAGMLNNLGNVALREGDFASTLRFHREALTLRQRLQAGSADVAASLNNIGSAERNLGNFDAARTHLERALELKRAIAPGTSTLANTLAELGIVAVRQGRLIEADRLYAECRIIRERTAPGSPAVAEIMFLQGALVKQSGHRREAERLWRKAIAIMEQTQAGLPLSAYEPSRFGAQFYLFYGALARLLAEDGRGEEAFALMEGARARALRAMLVGAQSIPAGVPGRLWTSYRQTLLEIGRSRARLALNAASEDTPSKSEAALELQRLEETRDRLTRELRAAAPRLATLDAEPTPTLDEVRQALDPGTVLLSYVVGENQTVLFVVEAAADSNAPPTTHVISVESEELERRIEILRAFISRGAFTRGVDRALVVQARKLFDLLLAPAMEEIEAAQRLLIVPDGPLREAPFAAFVLPGEPVRYLGSWKPIFFNPSAGAFMALRTRRQGEDRAAGTGIVAFGDPDYAENSNATRELRLRPLQGSRSEVRRIAAGFGDDARLYLGREATEQRLRSLRNNARFLHFAVHARSDARFPLESALYLSMPTEPSAPPEGDGVLRAWEIMDGLRFNADVVVLSGCSTGRGERVAGEGILSLARAFQYAGADTLVVSQWPVADRPTSELMVAFYARLRRGLTTIEALQRTQAELLTAPVELEGGQTLDARHPFFWAAFQVMGDWR
ncbi:MAG: CHAT domain-containing protein [Thermoanaerobaculales bacterium]